MNPFIIHNQNTEETFTTLDLDALRTSAQHEDHRFRVKEGKVGIDLDEPMYLVSPAHVNPRWNKDNLWLRSCIVNHAGEIVSFGLPKFPNLGESPAVFSSPSTLEQVTAITEKLDGSLLILSKYQGQFMIRTRGVFDATDVDGLPHNDEIDNVFKNKILPKFTPASVKSMDVQKIFSKHPDFEKLSKAPDFNDLMTQWVKFWQNMQAATWNFSLFFEWVSIRNKIVIQYNTEPEFIFIGGASHNRELWDHPQVDAIAHFFNLQKRQELKAQILKNTQEHIKQTKKENREVTLEDVLQYIRGLVGVEGFVLHTNNGLFKVKTDWYLAQHKAKFNFNENTIFDLLTTRHEPDAKSWETAEDIQKIMLETGGVDFETYSAYSHVYTLIQKLHEELEIETKNCFLETELLLQDFREQHKKEYSEENKARLERLERAEVARMITSKYSRVQSLGFEYYDKKNRKLDVFAEFANIIYHPTYTNLLRKIFCAELNSKNAPMPKADE